MESRPLLQRIRDAREILTQKPPLYEILTLNLATARIDEPIHISGDFLYISEAPSTISASVKFNYTQADSISLKKGRRHQIPFTKLYVSNAAGSGSLTLIIGKDLSLDFEDVGVINIDQIEQPIYLKGVNSMDAASSPVNVTQAATLIAAARSTRYQIMLYNEGNNPVRIGKADVTFANKGIILQPGASMTSNYTGAIYAICGAGLTTSISFIDEYSS